MNDTNVKPPTVITAARQPIDMSDEVREALRDGAPVVALESTIIAHGLPYPDNLDIARELDATVRSKGAVPATIAVIDGVLKAGLGDRDLMRLARGGSEIAKAGAADLAVHMAKRTSAATTVSATSWIAHCAGISVFATGGIGGVHRRASFHDPFDVSSDLSTLARVPIAVVSAGAKAILDIPATLEALETLGVLVVGYQTNEMPAFYTRSCGASLEHRADSPDELSRLLRARFAQLGQTGVLVANPIPADAALDPDEVDTWLSAALADADAQHINGKVLTPFLLAQLAQRSNNRTVTANRALALNNAKLAAQLRAMLPPATT